MRFNKKKLLCVIGNCRMLIKSLHTFIRSVLAKKLVSDGTGHLLIVGQSSFPSVRVSRRHVTDPSFQVIVRICLLWANSPFSASSNTLAQSSCWQKQNSIVLRQMIGGTVSWCFNPPTRILWQMFLHFMQIGTSWISFLFLHGIYAAGK